MAGAQAALRRNDTGRSSGQSRRRDMPRPSVGSTSSRTLPIGRTTGTSIEWRGKTRSGPVDGRANPETTRTDRASWGPTIVSEASSVMSRGGGNACDPTLRGTLEGDNRLDHIRAHSRESTPARSVHPQREKTLPWERVEATDGVCRLGPTSCFGTERGAEVFLGAMSLGVGQNPGEAVLSEAVH